MLALHACAPPASSAQQDTSPPPPGPAYAADAASYLWRPVAVGGGGFITGYSADARGQTRVIRTDVYGAYIWRADLHRWVQLVTSATMPAAFKDPAILSEGVFEIVVAPSDPDRIYMATQGHLYRSNDAGAHFTRATSSPVAFDPNSEFRHYGPFIAVSPRDPNLVLFGTPADGLWRSADGGATWQAVASAPRAADLRPAPGVQAPGIVVWFAPSASGARIWAMSPGHGVFESNDGGVTFAPLASAGTAPLTLRRGAFAADGAFFGVDSEQQKVWMYRDGRWNDLTGRPGLAPRRYAAVAINPTSHEVFVFDEGGRPFASGDGGQSWRALAHSARVGRGDPPWLHVTDLSYFASGEVTFDPVAPNRAWVAAGAGVYYAEAPRGVSEFAWTSQTRGVEELVANDIAQPPGRAPLFAAWDFGIHVKQDLNAFSTTYGPRERVLIAAQQVDWSPADPSFIVTNASDTRTFCCAEDGQAVLAGYSTDAGQTWRRFAALPQPPGTRPDDPWRMAFGTIAVSANDVNNIVWAPSSNRAPFYTKDRGATWRQVHFPGEIGPDTGSYERYYFHRKTLAADRVAPGTFYLAHSGEGANAQLAGLWRTQDGGATWRKVFNGEIAPQSRFSAKLRAVPGHAGHIFFTTDMWGAGDTALRRSFDGGSTWQVVSGVDHVRDIGFGRAAAGADYPAIYIAGYVRGAYGVWRSTDNAQSWIQIGQFPVGSLDHIVAIEADKDVFGRVYVGFMGSGWAYGEPARCQGQPYRFADAQECFAARASAR